MARPLAHSHSAFKQYEICPKQYHAQRIVKSVKPSFGAESIFGNRVHEQLDQRLKRAAQLPDESAKHEALCAAFESLPGELLSEQEMTLNNKLEPTGWWSDDAWLRSKIDVLVLNGPLAVMGDWKTGKRRYEEDQLELFAAQIFKHYPAISRIRASYIWLKEGSIDHATYSRADEPSLWNSILGKVHRIEKSVVDNDWPATPSGLCGWCPLTKAMCGFRR